MSTTPSISSSSSSPSTHVPTSVPVKKVKKSKPQHLDDWDDDVSESEFQREEPSSWKTSAYVPLSLFFGAVALGVGIVIAGRKSGKGLSQRAMEARVMAQATAVGGLIGVGVYSTITRTKQRTPESESESQANSK